MSPTKCSPVPLKKKQHATRTRGPRYPEYLASLRIPSGRYTNRKDEVAAYGRLPVVPMLAEPDGAPPPDPLQWWATNKRTFPHLAKMARCYLAVTATSVPSERAFSRGGSIVTKALLVVR